MVVIRLNNTKAEGANQNYTLVLDQGSLKWVASLLTAIRPEIITPNTTSHYIISGIHNIHLELDDLSKINYLVDYINNKVLKGETVEHLEKTEVEQQRQKEVEIEKQVNLSITPEEDQRLKTRVAAVIISRLLGRTVEEYNLNFNPENKQYVVTNEDDSKNAFEEVDLITNYKLHPLYEKERKKLLADRIKSFKEHRKKELELELMSKQVVEERAESTTKSRLTPQKYLEIEQKIVLDTIPDMMARYHIVKRQDIKNVEIAENAYIVHMTGDKKHIIDKALLFKQLPSLERRLNEEKKKYMSAKESGLV